MTRSSHSVFDAKYNHKTAETALAEVWSDSPVYAWDEGLPKDLDYVIDTPPPTVSGTLHIGHVYSYTQADIIARFFRMSGRNVLYPIGWDNNGLPTERLVEKVKKVRGGNMAREEFVDLCRSVIPKYHTEFRSLFTRLGLSVDWSREYQTISEESRAVSQLSFLDLFDKGVLERRLEPTLWDPADRTAIAQAEVDELEKEGLLNTLAFDVEGGEEVEIATTRPELLAGCVALMIHPDHPRASELVGKRALSPLYGAYVPILAEDTVDPDKGTGVVMCCTFGDVTDIDWWRSHGLPLRLVVDAAGRLIGDLEMGGSDWPVQDEAKAREMVEAMAGLKVKVARPTILEKLEESGDLRSQEKTNQVVPIAERSGHPLEINVTPQWFIKTLDYKEGLLEKGREIAWYPEYMYQRYENWVNGLKWDWAISRQRHFGVPLPVWYSKREGEEGKILLPTKDQLPVNPLTDLPEGYSADEVEPESDVFDTWATSSVSPQLVTRSVSPENGYDTDLHSRLFPMSMRPQAHDIIRTWAFYTIVKAFHHQQDVPWKDICISGWCLAEDGTKMSKSKGNIVDPIRILDQYGSDVVRYWTGTSRLGNDTVLSPNTLKQGKKLVTKLWNACKLAHMAFDGHELDATTPVSDMDSGRLSHPLDLWLMGRLGETVRVATEAMEAYEYARAFRAVEEFFWADFCDNYLELVKYRIRPEDTSDPEGSLSARLTLLHAGRAVLALFAPLMPYVTDSIWPAFALDSDPETGLHARGMWPDAKNYPAEALNSDAGAAVTDIVSAMRKVKTSVGVSMRKDVERMHVWPVDGQADVPEIVKTQMARDLSEISKAAEIVFAKADASIPSAQSPSERYIVALEIAPDPED